MGTAEINEINKVLPYFLKHRTLWSNYDDEADTLYLHFKKPNHSDDSEMVDDDMIIRYENKEVVGLTILNASKRNLL